MQKKVEGYWFRAWGLECERPKLKYLKSLPSSHLGKWLVFRLRFSLMRCSPHGLAKGNRFTGRAVCDELLAVARLADSSLSGWASTSSLGTSGDCLPSFGDSRIKAGLCSWLYCCAFLLWNPLCGSRGSLLNGPKEFSSKPKSSKCSPSMCRGLAAEQL